MKIQECPCCFERIMPKNDNACPACGINVQFKSSESVTRTKASIKDIQKLPNICYKCGNESDLFLIFKAKKQDYKDSDSALPLKAYSTIGYLIYLIINKFVGDYFLKIKIPICRSCKINTRKIVPKYIDFENSRIDLIVHKNFKYGLECKE